jgi:Binding-protein-dependent transport system inner membrane component
LANQSVWAVFVQQQLSGSANGGVESLVLFAGGVSLGAASVSGTRGDFFAGRIHDFDSVSNCHDSAVYLDGAVESTELAFGIFLLRQAFQGVPKELEEAARMDGCSELGIWWFVMLPSIRPALVTLAIFVFIGSWSDFLWPLLILDQPDYYTLPLGVAKLAGAFSLDWRLIAAGSVISIAPILLFFGLMQRYIVPTETGSGVKG